MATLYECDKCKKVFSSRFHVDIFQKEYNELEMVTMVSGIKNGFILCHDCSKKLMDFLDENDEDTISIMDAIDIVKNKIKNLGEKERNETDEGSTL